MIWNANVSLQRAFLYWNIFLYHESFRIVFFGFLFSALLFAYFLVNYVTISFDDYISHYNGVIMGMIASQITGLTIVYSMVYFRRRSKKTSKLPVTGLSAGISLGTGEFPVQMASNAENVSIWWRHHGKSYGYRHYAMEMFVFLKTSLVMLLPMSQRKICS